MVAWPSAVPSGYGTVQAPLFGYAPHTPRRASSSGNALQAGWRQSAGGPLIGSTSPRLPTRPATRAGSTVWASPNRIVSAPLQSKCTPCSSSVALPPNRLHGNSAPQLPSGYGLIRQKSAVPPSPLVTSRQLACGAALPKTQHFGVLSGGITQALEWNSGDLLLHSCNTLSPETPDGLTSLSSHTADSDVGSKEPVSDAHDEDKPFGMNALSFRPDPEAHHRALTLARCSGWSVPVVCGSTEEVPVELQSQECAWHLPKLKRYSVGAAPRAIEGINTM